MSIIKKMFCAILGAVSSVTPMSDLMATEYVVSPGDGIQTVIDRAVDGDVVLLLPGRHALSKEIVINKGVSLRGSGPREAIVIDGCNVTRCVYLKHAHGGLEGLTVTRGYTANANGAGVCCEAGRVQDCVIVSNRLVASGDSYVGGGIYVTSSSSIVSNCVIAFNSANYGGGMLVRANVQVRDCWIGNNEASQYGGGAYSSTALQNCSVVHNSAYIGGGVYVFGGSVDSCQILSNSVTKSGGGLYLAGTSAVTNSLIAGNSSEDSGGGIYSPYWRAQVVYCTLVGNRASIRGGGFAGSGPVMQRCILWANQAETYPDIYPLPFENTSLISYCCSSTALPGVRNLGLDPMFANAEEGDYRLRLGSPCVDACPLWDAVGKDVSGLSRGVDGDGDGIALDDMGAYEFHPGSSLGRQYKLVIRGTPMAIGESWPLNYGTHSLPALKWVVASVPAVAEVNGSRYTCKGWKGRGSVPRWGTTNSVTFYFRWSSTLTWLWKVEHPLSLMPSQGTVVGAESGFLSEGETADLTFVPNAGYRFHHWEINGQYGGRDNPLSVTMDRAQSIQPVCELLEGQTNVVTFDTWSVSSQLGAGVTNGPILLEGGLKLVSSPTKDRPNNGTPYVNMGLQPGAPQWIRPLVRGRFSLLSADVAEYTTTVKSMVRVIGYRSDGGCLTNDIALDGVVDGLGGADDFQQVVFTNWVDLAAVEVCGDRFSLDNLAYALSPTDVDSDGLDDAWEDKYFGDTSRSGREDFDGDGLTDFQEWLAGTDPRDPNSRFSIYVCRKDGRSNGVEVGWSARGERFYTLFAQTNLSSKPIPLTTLPGQAGEMYYTNFTKTADCLFFRVGVRQ